MRLLTLTLVTAVCLSLTGFVRAEDDTRGAKNKKDDEIRRYFLGGCCPPPCHPVCEPICPPPCPPVCCVKKVVHFEKYTCMKHEVVCKQEVVMKPVVVMKPFVVCKKEVVCTPVTCVKPVVSYVKVCCPPPCPPCPPPCMPVCGYWRNGERAETAAAADKIADKQRK